MSREIQVRFCESRGVKFPPATHLLVLCRSREQAQAALQRLRSLLAELGLAPKEAKTRIVHLRVDGEGFDFLGFHHRLVRSRPGMDVGRLSSWPAGPRTRPCSMPGTGFVSSRTGTGCCSMLKRACGTSMRSGAAGRGTSGMGTRPNI